MPQLIQGTALAEPGFIEGWLGQVIDSEGLLKHQMLWVARGGLVLVCWVIACRYARRLQVWAACLVVLQMSNASRELTLRQR